MIKKPILICTFCTLTSGLLGTLVGLQITSSVVNQKCDQQFWNLKQQICTVWETPGAIWQGGTTGLWTGLVLGAFVGGSVVRKIKN